MASKAQTDEVAGHVVRPILINMMKVNSFFSLAASGMYEAACLARRAIALPSSPPSCSMSFKNRSTALIGIRVSFAFGIVTLIAFHRTMTMVFAKVAIAINAWLAAFDAYAHLSALFAPFKHSLAIKIQAFFAACFTGNDWFTAARASASSLSSYLANCVFMNTGKACHFGSITVFGQQDDNGFMIYSSRHDSLLFHPSFAAENDVHVGILQQGNALFMRTSAA